MKKEETDSLFDFQIESENGISEDFDDEDDENDEEGLSAIRFWFSDKYRDLIIAS